MAYTTAAWLLGRLATKRGRPVLAFLAGWAILRAIAIVPVLGGLTWFAAVVVGLGAIAVATTGRGDGQSAPRRYRRWSAPRSEPPFRARLSGLTPDNRAENGGSQMSIMSSGPP